MIGWIGFSLAMFGFGAMAAVLYLAAEDADHRRAMLGSRK